MNSHIPAHILSASHAVYTLPGRPDREIVLNGASRGDLGAMRRALLAAIADDHRSYSRGVVPRGLKSRLATWVQLGPIRFSVSRKLLVELLAKR
jgi:hypothetical protein